MPKLCNINSIIFLLALLLPLTGCASDHVVSLKMEPQTNRKLAAPKRVVLVALEDKRDGLDDPRYIGDIRNAVGAITARVNSIEPDPVATVTDIFAAELRRAGFEVTQVVDRSAPVPDAPLVIRGEVTYLFTGMKGVALGGAFSTTVKIHLAITKSGQVTDLSRSETEHDGFGLSPKSSEIQTEFHKTTSLLMNTLVGDVIKAAE